MTSKQLIASIAMAGSLVAGGTVNNINLQAQDTTVNPYTDTGSTLEMGVKGDKVDVDKAAPKITLSKWNGQDSLGVSYSKTKTNGKSTRKSLSTQVEYPVDNKQTVVMEPTADGEGFNIDVVLASKPTSNVFTYTFQNWQDKDFFYQPPLSVEMASSTCTETDCGGFNRPANVVGSYAVYSKVHKDHALGQTNYQTGKLFHIYRPLVTDNSGATTWAALDIKDGVMKVTVPQEFLDNAQYPVVVDPTFGNTTLGASSGNECLGSGFGGTGNRSGIVATGIVGTLTSLSAAVHISGSAGNITNAILINTKDVPSSGNHAKFVKYEAVWAVTTSPTFYSITAGGETLSATSYILDHICKDTDLGSGDRLRIEVDSATSTHCTASWLSAYATARDQDPWVATCSTGTFGNYSIYATYAAGGGGGTAPSPQLLNFQ